MIQDPIQATRVEDQSAGRAPVAPGFDPWRGSLKGPSGCRGDCKVKTPVEDPCSKTKHPIRATPLEHPCPAPQPSKCRPSAVAVPSATPVEDPSPDPSPEDPTRSTPTDCGRGSVRPFVPEDPIQATPVEDQSAARAPVAPVSDPCRRSEPVLLLRRAATRPLSTIRARTLAPTCRDATPGADPC